MSQYGKPNLKVYYSKNRRFVYFNSRALGNYRLPDLDDPEFEAAYAEACRLNGGIKEANSKRGAARKHKATISHLSPPQGYVYVFGFATWVKIGFSTDVPKRLSTLSTGCPEALRLYFCRPGNVDTERALHIRFAEYQSRNEWFRLEGHLKKWVEEQTHEFLFVTKGRNPFPAPGTKAWQRKIVERRLNALPTLQA
jgi:hypothetical protein